MLKLFKSYIASPTHRWWVDNVWRPSWTRLAAWIYGLPAMAISLATQIGDWANNDTIKGLIDQMNVPHWVPQLITVIALIHILARGHK